MKVTWQLTRLPPKLTKKAIITLNFEALYSHLVNEPVFFVYVPLQSLMIPLNFL